MTKWEYLHIRSSERMESMNELGQKGWRFIWERKIKTGYITDRIDGAAYVNEDFVETWIREIVAAIDING